MLIINIIIHVLDTIKVVNEKFSMEPDYPISKVRYDKQKRFGSFAVGEFQFLFGNLQHGHSHDDYITIDFKRAAFPYVKVYGACATPTVQNSKNNLVIYKFGNESVTFRGLGGNNEGTFLIWGKCKLHS